MFNNIDDKLAKIKEHLKKQYIKNKNRLLAQKTVVYLKNIRAVKLIKPIHGVLLATLLVLTALAFLPPKAGKVEEKPVIELSDVKDGTVVVNGSSQVSRGGIDRSDRYLLARVIEGEAADEPMTGKVAVGAVIINRTRSKDFPHDIKQVVYQPMAFEAVANGQYNRPLTTDALKAADLAISGEDPTNGALYYWNPAKSSSEWVWQRPVTMQIGRHVFAK